MNKVFDSCAISCFKISRDFVVWTMTRQNQKLNETYLEDEVWLGFYRVMSSTRSHTHTQQAYTTHTSCANAFSRDFLCYTHDSAESQSNFDFQVSLVYFLNNKYKYLYDVVWISFHRLQRRQRLNEEHIRMLIGFQGIGARAWQSS